MKNMFPHIKLLYPSINYAIPAKSLALVVSLTPASQKLRSHAQSRLQTNFSRLTEKYELLLSCLTNAWKRCKLYVNVHYNVLKATTDWKGHINDRSSMEDSADFRKRRGCAWQMISWDQVLKMIRESLETFRFGHFQIWAQYTWFHNIWMKIPHLCIRKR